MLSTQQVAHVAGDVAGDLAVGDHLVVGDQLPDLGAAVLEAEAVADRAEVVADVQRAGRTVPGQHAQRGRVLRHLLLDGVAASLCGAEGVTHAVDPFTGAIGAAIGFCRVSEVPTIGVAIAIPEPWASELQDYRTSVGDTTATQIPTHITLVPPTEVPDADLQAVCAHLTEAASAVPRFDIHLRGTGTFRPVSPVVFVTLVEGISRCEVLADAVRQGRSRSTCTSRTTRTSPSPTTSTTRARPGVRGARRVRVRVRRRRVQPLRPRRRRRLAAHARLRAAA